MDLELTQEQKAYQAEFRHFVREELLPYANDYDKQGFIPPEPY